MRKQGNTTWLTWTEEKALTMVGAFFVVAKRLNIKGITGTLYPVISGTVCSGIVTCFIPKIEHKNLHRNTPNINLLYPAADQQLKRVVTKCSVWWY